MSANAPFSFRKTESGEWTVQNDEWRNTSYRAFHVGEEISGGEVLVFVAEGYDGWRNESRAMELGDRVATAITAHEEICTALQSLSDWFGLGHGVSRNNLDQYEHLAAEFYRETGRMRPGKDSAAAANESEDHKAETGRIWREWIAKKEEELIAMVGGALAKARGES